MLRIYNNFEDGKPEKYIRRAKIYLSLVMEANENFDTTQDPCLLDIVQSMTGGEQIKIYRQYERELAGVGVVAGRVAKVAEFSKLDTYYGACRDHLVSGKLFEDTAEMRRYLTANELYSGPRQI